MSYNNLQNQQTSVSATWGTVKANGLSYSSVSLDSGVPHIDQLEIERVFTLDSAVQQAIDPYDLHQVFLLQKTEYTLNESTSKLTAFSITGSRTYTCKSGSLINTQITIPIISDSDLVIVRRKTMSMTPYVSWVSGSRLTSAQLNQQVKQLMRLNQELIYKLETEYVRVTDISGTSAPSLTLNNDLNANSNKISGLGMPSGSFSITSNPQYAANKGYVDTNFVNLSTNQTIAGNKTFSGATTLSSTLAVTGATTLSSTLGVTGATTLSSTLAVTGATTLSSGLTVDTNTLFVDATNHRVGIGNTTPASPLDITTAASTNAVTLRSPGYLNLQLISNGISSYVQASNSGGVGTLSLFGGQGATADLSITGNKVGIGKSPTTTLDVNGTAAISSTLSVSGATNLGSTLGVTGITVLSSTVTAPNVKITGTASTDVNTLDAYQEGTWTPSFIAPNGSLGGTLTYVRQLGWYTKIGDTVTAHFRVTVNGKSAATAGSGTYLQLTGLPFNIANLSLLNPAGTIAYANGFTANFPNGLYGTENSNTCYLVYNTGTAVTGYIAPGNNNAANTVTPTWDLIGTITYKAAT